MNGQTHDSNTEKEFDLISTGKTSGIPKRILYTSRLIQHNQPSNRLQKIGSLFTRNKKDPVSITEWTKRIGSKPNNSMARQFLQKLVDQKILVKKGMAGQENNEYPVYILDKKRLINCFYQSEYYEINKPLFMKAIKQCEPGKTITSEI